MIWNERIHDLRKEHGLTLKEVATKLGVTEATAQRYESRKGIKNIPYDIIIEYAKLFGVSPSYIMGWEAEPRKADLFVGGSSDAPDMIIKAINIEKIKKSSKERLDQYTKIFSQLSKLDDDKLELASKLVDTLDDKKEHTKKHPDG